MAFPLNSGALPPGLAGYVAMQNQLTGQDQVRQQQATGLMGLLNAVRQQQQAEQMQPLQRQLLQAQIANAQAQEPLRVAQMEELRRKSEQARAQQAAQQELARTLATGGNFGPVQPGAVSGVTGELTPELLAQMQAADAAGQPVDVRVPNRMGVLNQFAQAYPNAADNAVKAMFPPPSAAQRPLIVPPGASVLPQGGTTPIFTAPHRPPVDRPEPAPVAVIGDDGKPTLVRREDAIGKTPAPPANASGREQNDMIRRVTGFGTALDKSGVPQAYAVLNEVERTVNEKVLPYLTGFRGVIPDIALSKEITDARQALQRMLNIQLKDRSGAAVTVPEWERFKKETGVGLLKKPEQIAEAIKQGKTILDKHYQSIAAGFPADVRESYFSQLGGVEPFQGSGQPADTGGGPPPGAVRRRR